MEQSYDSVNDPEGTDAEVEDLQSRSKTPGLYLLYYLGSVKGI